MRRARKNGNGKEGSVLAGLAGGLLILVGGAAVLCGFGMSDTMSAPGSFCLLLSICGAAALLLGLRLQGRRTEARHTHTAGLAGGAR